MAGKRSSGYDFADKQGPLGDTLAAHPDLVLSRQPTSNLQRNKTERNRLQGLARSKSSSETASLNGATPPSKMKDRKWLDRWHTWLINGGRGWLIGAAYVFLHLIVFALGFLHYELKDGNAGIRSLVGFGFGEFLFSTDFFGVIFFLFWEEGVGVDTALATPRFALTRVPPISV
jgi:NADPH oxidase